MVWVLMLVLIILLTLSFIRWDRKKVEVTEWHRWFAWYPVEVQPGYWVWGEYVLRIRRSGSWFYKDAFR